MRRFESGIALLGVLCLLAPAASAQYVQTRSGGRFSGLTRPYEPRQITPVDLANSARLESLLRAGNIYLSLQDAIALALENNLDIQWQRYNRPQAEASLLRSQAGGLLRGVPASVQTSTTAALSQITGGAFGTGGSTGTTSGGGAGGTIITATGTAIPNLDPSFYVAGYWGHHTSPQTNSFTTGTNFLVYRNSAYNAGIQQGFSTGTNVSLAWSQSTAKTNSSVIDFNPYTNGSLNLQITQRLLQGFGLAVNNRNIKIAKNNMRVTDLAFKQQVIQTVSAVIAAYWDLVSDIENVNVRRQALALSQRLYEDNKKQVEIGTLAPIEIVRAEAEVASNQQQLVVAQTALLQQETLLKNALSRIGVASPSIAEAHIIPTDHITVPATEAVAPIQDLVAKAMAGRPELAQSRINLDSAKIGLKGSRSQLLPSLDMMVNLTNNALAGQVNPIPPPEGSIRLADPYFIGGTSKVMRQLLARNFPDYAIGVQLSFPIRNRSAQADYTLDALSLRQQEIQQQSLINQIRVDVQNAMIAQQQARAGYQAAAKARVLAEQSLDAEQKRYALGASTIFLVIQYQRDLAQARSTEVTAASSYAKAKVQLDMATGDTLEANSISIGEATQGRVSRPPSPLPPVQP